jgi:hypothetical protein
LIEGFAPVPLSDIDTAKEIIKLVDLYGGVDKGGNLKVAKLLGVSPTTLSRRTILEREVPDLVEMGAKEGVGLRKVSFVKDILDAKPEMNVKGAQETLMRVAGELPRTRLESVKSEAQAGYNIKPGVESRKAKTQRAHTIFIREDIFEALGKYSNTVKKTSSDIIEEALMEFPPFKGFLTEKKIAL